MLEWIRENEVRAWITLGVTVTAVVIGFMQLGDERRSRRQDERRLATTQRRQQAETVSAWIAADTEQGQRIVLSNRSVEPVYRVVVTIVDAQAGPVGIRPAAPIPRAFQQTVLDIPPGQYMILLGRGFGGMGRRPGVEIAFTDRAGVYWMRTVDGTLHELGQDPVSYYHLLPPLALQIPQPLNGRVP